MTLKAGYFFEINHQFFLAFCGSGRGFAAGKKLTGILNVNEPVTSQSWTEHQIITLHFAFCKKNLNFYEIKQQKCTTIQ